MKLKLFVFSYNRGIFLENCIESIEACAPNFPLTIIDDNSDDDLTKSKLETLKKKYEVVVNTPEKRESKTGGLYENMNMAMNMTNNDFEYVLFIQDDMQFTRPFTEKDQQLITGFFDSNNNTFQYVCNFLRNENSHNFLLKNTIDSSRAAYLTKSEFEEGKSNFGATGIFHVNKFRKLFSEFLVGEGANNQKAKNLGLQYGRSIYPFMNWLPYPVSFRGKKRAWLHKLIEKIGGAGYHPIEFMSNETFLNFMNRRPEQLPIMEKWLYSPSAPRHDKWSTAGGEYNIMARDGVIAKLLKTTKRLKKLFLNLI